MLFHDDTYIHGMYGSMGIMHCEASIWKLENSLTWTLELILPNVRRKYEGASAHTCMLFHVDTYIHGMYGSMGIMHCEASVWKLENSLTWTLELILPNVRRKYGGWGGGGLVHTHACYSMMTLISMECMEVWALWSINSQPPLQRWCLLPKMWC